MSEFHFLRPLWLLGFVPLTLMLWWLARPRDGERDWQTLCDPELLPHLLIQDGGGPRRTLAWALWGLAGGLAILALAGPVWERQPAPAFRNEAALVIVLDLSRAMDAADLKPSRLERARYKIEDILAQRKDGLTALLVYSGEPFTVTPLTDDTATIQAQLTALSTDLMPTQGSRADLALEQAGRLLQQSGLRQGDILLITHGLNLGKAEPVARRLGTMGYRVSVLGAGSEAGGPVPLPEGGFLQNTHGDIVISKLASSALRQLAEQGGGLYRTLSPDVDDVTELLAYFERHSHTRPTDPTGTPIAVDLWHERGPWLLVPLLPIAALAFRRGLLVIGLVLVLPAMKPVHAFEWRDLWQTPDQHAQQAFAAGDFAKAAAEFADPAWKAAAQYRAGDYQGASTSLEGLSSADASYNQGNALAKQGRFQEAIAAYDRALTLDPTHEDARHNKALVEKALQDQRQKKPEQEPSQGKEPQNKAEEGSNGAEGKDGQTSKQQQDSREEKGADHASNHEADRTGRHDERSSRQHEPTDEDSRTLDNKDQVLQTPKEPGRADAEPGDREEQQANEQWLRRIPDDPGGLLRRKFFYQYQQRQGRNPQ